jgi:acetylornithine deacetylase/succinyl-diaminopimelate desuccinylase-like protein
VKRFLKSSFNIAVLVVSLTAVAASLPVVAQSATSRVDDYVAAHQREIVTALFDLVSIPNARGDGDNLRRNALALQEMLAMRGFTADVIDTPGAPLVVGGRSVRGATRTLLLYAHYDGQPVDPPRWRQPTPFTPILRTGRLDEPDVQDIANPKSLSRFEPEWRLYGRSTADDKAPIIALCAALDAFDASGMSPTWNLKILLDGDEESNSTGLKAVVGSLRERLASDLMVMLDGPAHPTGRPTVVLGARGELGFELTVYGPKGELHSGHYGNWAPNPAIRLARLLASMKDDSGKVVIKGFYDGIAPLTADERALLRAVPDDPGALLSLFGLAAPEPIAESLQEAYQRPSLNIRGLASGRVGRGATNVIPSQAVASLDIRLVTETPAAATLEKVKSHIRAQGFHIVETDPDDGTRARYRDIVKLTTTTPTEAYRVSVTNPMAKAVIGALTGGGQQPVILRTSGATVPTSELTRAIGAPAASVQMVNFDDNQHTDNENIRLGHLFTAVKTIAALLTMP